MSIGVIAYLYTEYVLSYDKILTLCDYDSGPMSIKHKKRRKECIMNRKIVLVDMDGVMVDYTKAFLEKAFEQYPELRHLEREAWLHWDTEKAFPKELRKGLEVNTLREGFFLNLEPIAGAIEAIREMSKLFDVYICTAPKWYDKYCVPEKYESVRRLLGQGFAERIIMTRDKTLVRGDYLIDDKPLIKGAAVPEWEHLLFDQPYNNGVTDKRRINWDNWRSVLL